MATDILRTALLWIASIIICWGGYVFFKAWRIYHTSRFPLRPHAAPTIDSNLPISFRPMLARWLADLNALGFEVVENVHFADYGPGQTMTHFLLINRLKRQRASIMCITLVKSYLPTLTFVTLWADGTEIKTAIQPRRGGIREIMPGVLVLTMPIDTPVAELYAEHEKRCAIRESSGLEKILPPAGQEASFLEDQHAKVIAASVEKGILKLDRSGMFYRATRKKAIRTAFRSTWPVKPILIWHYRRSNKTRRATAQLGQIQN